MYNFHKYITILLSTVLIFLFSGCLSESKKELKMNIDHAVIEEGAKQINTYIDYQYFDKNMNFGETASKEEIAGWDIDIRPDGQGLPKGKGSVAFGEEVYLQKCAVCHGDFGEGADRWPPLAGGEGSLHHQRKDGDNEGPHKTIGSYWPYASTIFDYIKRAMPYPAPQTLTDDEVYALTAYMLVLNDIQIDGKDLDSDFVLSNENFNKIKLPNEKNFYPQGDMKTPTRTSKSPNTRCMSNCKDGKEVKEIEVLKGVTPLGPLQRKDETKQIKKSNSMGKDSKFKSLYENKCSVCHASGIGDAPILGDKPGWKDIIKAGKDTIYKNAIQGKGGMPPKGGDMSLSDEDVKGLVDYMLSLSQ